MATHSRILAWRIPWTEEPGGLQCIGSQRVRHNCRQAEKNLYFDEKCVYYGIAHPSGLSDSVGMILQLCKL